MSAIRIRAAFLAIVGIACLAFVPAKAYSGVVGIGDIMCACPGLPKALGRASSCEAACGLTPPTGSSDNGAARRAWEAAAAAAAAAELRRQAEEDRIERERLAEEKRKKDAEFIRNRDATVSTLKGSSGAAMGQLKGLSGADNFGLKGSEFDTGGTGLKELRGSAHVDQNASSQSQPTRSSVRRSAATEGSNDGSKNKEACHPSQDPSVVDLCFLGGKPAAIDPWILKGMSPAERTLLKTSAKNMTEDLLPFDQEIYQTMANLMVADPAKTGKQWPGPHNPGTRYLNPLSEPEKVKAYWDKVNAGLHMHAEAQAKIAAATPKGMDWHEVVARQDADPKFRQSKEQIMRDQDNAEILARTQMLIKFREFLAKQGGTDWPDRIKNDKLFTARMVMEREALFKKMDQEIYSVRGKSLQQMTDLVKAWKAK